MNAGIPCKIDQGTQTFTYGLYPHDGSWENAATARRAKMMNCQPTALFETYHEGSLKQTGSLLEVNQENIVVEVLKKAEDGSGDVIDPDSVPVGQYSKEALTNLGLWDEVLAKASLGTNVTEVLNWVAEGSAKAGIVYATDAAQTDKVTIDPLLSHKSCINSVVAATDRRLSPIPLIT